MRIDPHVHSNFSDGRSSVEEIFALSKRINLDAIALTDHDTHVGWKSAHKCVEKYGVGFIPGAEISTGMNGKIYHLLAYLYDEKDPKLQSLYDQSKKERFTRFMKMVQILKNDYDFSIKDLIPENENISLPAKVTPKFLQELGLPFGRPHLADALIKSGYFKNRDECFSTVLHPEEKYFIPYVPPSVIYALQAVKNAGGFAVLAHAFSYKRDSQIKLGTLIKLKNNGLGGLEVNHYEHNLKSRKDAYEISKILGLLQFGSSDYHGSGKPNKLGENLTNLETILKMEQQSFGKVHWGWIK